MNMLAREPALVGIAAHRVEELGGDDHTVARRELLESAAGDLLADAERVHVGGIEEVDAELDGAPEERAALLFFEDPLAPFLRPVGHAAETDAGDLEAGGAEANVFHEL